MKMVTCDQQMQQIQQRRQRLLEEPRRRTMIEYEIDYRSSFVVFYGMFSQLLDKRAIQELVKQVDPMLQIDEEVEDVNASFRCSSISIEENVSHWNRC